MFRYYGGLLIDIFGTKLFFYDILPKTGWSFLQKVKSQCPKRANVVNYFCKEIRWYYTQGSYFVGFVNMLNFYNVSRP